MNSSSYLFTQNQWNEKSKSLVDSINDQNKVKDLLNERSELIRDEFNKLNTGVYIETPMCNNNNVEHACVLGSLDNMSNLYSDLKEGAASNDINCKPIKQIYAIASGREEWQQILSKYANYDFPVNIVDDTVVTSAKGMINLVETLLDGQPSSEYKDLTQYFTLATDFNKEEGYITITYPNLKWYTGMLCSLFSNFGYKCNTDKQVNYMCNEILDSLKEEVDPGDGHRKKGHVYTLPDALNEISCSKCFNKSLEDINTNIHNSLTSQLNTTGDIYKIGLQNANKTTISNNELKEKLKEVVPVIDQLDMIQNEYLNVNAKCSDSFLGIKTNYFYYIFYFILTALIIIYAMLAYFTDKVTKGELFIFSLYSLLIILYFFNFIKNHISSALTNLYNLIKKIINNFIIKLGL